jgi:uracil phosphoribosyltransferase
MEEALLDLLPGAPVYHLGLYRYVPLRSPSSHHPTSYYLAANGPVNKCLASCNLPIGSLSLALINRDPISLQAIEYYSRLPQTINVDRIFILDPMVATGNTALAALQMMKEWGLGMEKVCFLGIIGSRKALEGLEGKYPDVHVSPAE